jgi:dephospho-CoA kinase
MLKVGLTGSIAVGKSYVCSVFRELGAFVIDADQIARDVVARGTPGLRRIVEEFGEEVIARDGSLDRKKLAEIVFNDEEKRLRLNAIVHPLVINEQDRILSEIEATDRSAIVIVEAALMIESGGFRRFDRLIVVWCRPEIQIQRLMSRDGLTRDEAEKRIAAQMPQSEKMRYADFLIDTSEGFESTRKQCEDVYAELKKLLP